DKLRVLHREVQAERDRILAAARADAEKIGNAGRAALAAEREAALDTLREQGTELGAEIAARLLREAAPDAPEAIFLAALERRYRAASDEERERLRLDLAPPAVLDVATATPLSPAAEAEWRERLTALLGPIASIRFVAEPSLIGGAELRFPHAVLGATWRDQIARAQRTASHDPAAAA
ncbi:MAG: hypothetical protein KIT16_22335, partial [Rhodospirillaceae bacterium]|nr:hypothetical protein [Rhodospirillaceae bacterium]